MTEPNTTLYVLGQPSNATAYHTTDDPEQCRKMKQCETEPRELSHHAAEWHELPECEYCSGVYEPWTKGPVASDD